MLNIKLSTMLKNNFKKSILEQRKCEMCSNLKRNWYFIISAMAFFCLNATVSVGYFAGILVAFIVWVLICSQTFSVWEYVKKSSISLQIISLMTAIGICWWGQTSFYTDWNTSEKVQGLKEMLPVSIDISGFVSIFGAVIAVYFVYCFTLMILKELAAIINMSGVCKELKAVEILIYGILFAISVIAVMVVFSRTEAFYGTQYSYDVIYTSDSPYLVKENAYFWVAHPENDLRQPLFAMFAAPFIGIPYLVSRLFGVSASVQAMLIDSIQVFMMFVAHFMLTKIMKLNPMKRICFMVLVSCTYTHLLFVFMMEQYIIAYFWLIFCIYLILEKKHPNRIAMWGAGGSLLTSMVLLPFMSNNSPINNFKAWIVDMVKYGGEFLIVLLAFCRFDVIFSLVSKISFLSGFSGHGMTTQEKVFQYTEFVNNCFGAPDAGVSNSVVSHISWQMNAVSGINVVGVIVLVMIIVSAIVNRDKKSSLFAVGWVGFSVIMLLLLGWGTRENGLVLYTLYFGWAFFLLLFQLVEKIENKLKVKFLIPVFCIGGAGILSIVNIPALMDMMEFAITFFPV